MALKKAKVDETDLQQQMKEKHEATVKSHTREMIEMAQNGELPPRNYSGLSLNKKRSNKNLAYTTKKFNAGLESLEDPISIDF